MSKFEVENYIIDTIAIFAIYSGLITISNKNPVISVLFLISLFINISAYLVIIGISFMGISYLIVYVGAVTVLFLFVIIIFNLQFTDFKQYQYNNKSIVIIIGSIFVYEIINVQEIVEYSLTSTVPFLNDVTRFIKNFNNIFIESKPYKINLYNIYNIESDLIFINFKQIESIGIVIYTNCVIWLILLTIILLLAIIGPISLNKNIHSLKILYFLLNI